MVAQSVCGPLCCTRSPTFSFFAASSRHLQRAPTVPAPAVAYLQPPAVLRHRPRLSGSDGLSPHAFRPTSPTCVVIVRASRIIVEAGL